MNPKQTAPLIALVPAIATITPPILIGGAIGLGILFLLKSILSENKETKPESVPADKAEIPRKVAETPVFRQIPAESPAKPIPAPSVPRAIVPPPAIPAIPNVAKIAAPAPVSAAVIVPKIIAQAPLPSPIKKKSVTRANMATIFQRGARTLTRTAAVMELKKLGFGKTAAYAALSPHGRFATWLHCAPDGIITWTDGQKAQTGRG